MLRSSLILINLTIFRQQFQYWSLKRKSQKLEYAGSEMILFHNSNTREPRLTVPDHHKNRAAKLSREPLHSQTWAHLFTLWRSSCQLHINKENYLWNRDPLSLELPSGTQWNPRERYLLRTWFILYFFWFFSKMFQYNLKSQHLTWVLI